MGRKGRPRAQRHLHPGLFPGASEQQPSPNTTGCQLGGLRASAGLTSSLAGQLPASLLLNEDRRPVTINYNTQQLQLMHCLSRRKLHRGHLPAAKGHSRQWLQLLWQPRERGQACRWAEEPWQLPEAGTSVWCGAQSRPWLFCLCTINLQGQRLLCGSSLCTVGCLAASLAPAHWMPVAPVPAPSSASCVNQKYLQTFPNVP